MNYLYLQHIYFKNEPHTPGRYLHADAPIECSMTQRCTFVAIVFLHKRIFKCHYWWQYISPQCVLCPSLSSLMRVGKCLLRRMQRAHGRPGKPVSLVRRSVTSITASRNQLTSHLRQGSLLWTVIGVG